MKYIIAILSICTYACSSHTTSENKHIEYKTRGGERASSVSANNLIKTIHLYENEIWHGQIQKIKDTYARANKVIEDKEIIDFSIAFFKVLSMNEDLDQEIFCLSRKQNELPNIDSLKYLYSAEKQLDRMITIILPFTKCSNNQICFCAIESEKYFEYLNDVLIILRDVDYRNLKNSEMPEGIPPEVLKAKAKLIEQRDRMAMSIISLYSNIADSRLAN